MRPRCSSCIWPASSTTQYQPLRSPRSNSIVSFCCEICLLCVRHPAGDRPSHLSSSVTATAVRVIQKKSHPDIGRLVCDPGLTKAVRPLPEGYCTTWFNTEDVLLSLKLSPKYCAVIGCVAMANVDLVSLATPPLNVADPIPTVPSKNFTLAASA